MDLREAVGLALEALGANKVRSALTMLGEIGRASCRERV